MTKELQTADAHKAYNTPDPFTNTKGDESIPERQVYSGQEESKWVLHNNSSRAIKVTAGFMEPSGHGTKKSSTSYLDSENADPSKPKTRQAGGKYNIGIDYVVGGDKQVVPWYSGTVVKSGLDGGYGNSVTVKTTQSYEYNGVKYPIYNTYSHLESIGKGITQGATVDTDTFIGKMGGTGQDGKKVYPDHVDFQSYIMVDGKKVQISPNLMQNNLKKQAENGTFQYSGNNSTNQTTAVASAQQSNYNSQDGKTVAQKSSEVSQEQQTKNELYAEIIEISGGSIDKAIQNMQAAQPPISIDKIEEMAAYGYQQQGMTAEESFSLAQKMASDSKPEGNKFQYNVDRSEAGKQLQPQA
jgi:Peptidase family M23